MFDSFLVRSRSGPLIVVVEKERLKQSVVLVFLWFLINVFPLGAHKHFLLLVHPRDKGIKPGNIKKKKVTLFPGYANIQSIFFLSSSKGCRKYLLFKLFSLWNPSLCSLTVDKDALDKIWQRSCYAATLTARQFPPSPSNDIWLNTH